jgi:hypothetical protein
MGKVVQQSVHVQNEETGEDKWYHAGDTLDDWAEDLVTNEAVFEAPSAEDIGLSPTNQETKYITDGDVSLEEIGGAPQPVDYTSLNISELDELLEERNLSKSGTKPEKIERLQAADAAVA